MNSAEQPSKDQRNDCHELDEDVDTGATGVFKRITNSITDDCCFVDIAALASAVTVAINHVTSLDVLLSIVPSTSRVGSRYGELHTRNDGSWEESSDSFWTESKPN